MGYCLPLLALAALSRSVSCISTSDLPDDNPPEAIHIESRRGIYIQKSTSMHEQKELHEERELGITDNVFAAASSTCQQECKSNTNTIRCIELCSCIRQERCNERTTGKERRQCRKMCKAMVDELINKGYQTISDYSCYRTVKGTFDTMASLESKFPNLVSTKDIGASYRVKNPFRDEKGYPIRLLNVTSATVPQGITEKTKVFVVAGVHPREYAPPEIVLRFAERLAEGYGKNADITWILDHNEIYILPIANPDGKKIAETNRSLFWRKNRNLSGCSRSNNGGVDINRNFPFKYGGARSSGNPCNDKFRGKRALSEPETKAIYDFAESIFPNSQKRGVTVAKAEANANKACGVDVTGVYLDLHSYGGLITYPWRWGRNKASPDDIEIETMARKLASYGGYGLWGPGQPDFMYAVGGGSVDTMYGLHCVASFGVEVSDSFYEKCEDFEGNTYPVNMEALIYSTKVASAPFRIPKGPDVLSLEIKSTTTDTITVTVSVSDKDRSVAYGMAFAATGNQNIKMVRIFVDDHPYTVRNSTVGQTMQPVGVNGFNSPTEMASLTIDTKGLSSGQHVVYVEAEDNSGSKGPISAGFFDV